MAFNDCSGKADCADALGLTRTMDWADRAAVGGSVACMIHCIGLPVTVGLLPTLAPVLNAPEAFHVWMLVLTIPITALTLFRSWTLHTQSAPMYLAFSGFALLAVGLCMSTKTAEALTTVLGGLLIAAAHISNWQSRRAC